MDRILRGTRICRLFLILVLLSVILPETHSQALINLSEQSWNLWPDKSSGWEMDELFLSPVDLSTVPYNPPTIGWSVLLNTISEDVYLPALIEDHVWHANTEAPGLTNTYEGVSWFYTLFSIPPHWKRKHIELYFETVQMRAEVYINEKLAGYNLVAGAPFSVDITKYIVPGTMNFLAVRVTDPISTLDADKHSFMWGEYEFHPMHAYGGILGGVSLRASDDVFVSDIYVRNLPKASSVRIEAEVTNSKSRMISGTLIFSLIDPETGKTIASKERYLDRIFDSWTISMAFLESDFEADPEIRQELWTLENPKKYRVKVEWKGKDRTRSALERDFGFRWVELQEEEEGYSLLINGEKKAVQAVDFPVLKPGTGTENRRILHDFLQNARQKGQNVIVSNGEYMQIEYLDSIDANGMLLVESFMLKPEADEFSASIQKERVLRIMQRDRNRPSLLMYHLQTEGDTVLDNEWNTFAKNAYGLDPSRIVTIGSFKNDSAHLEFPFRMKDVAILRPKETPSDLLDGNETIEIITDEASDDESSE